MSAMGEDIEDFLRRQAESIGVDGFAVACWRHKTNIGTIWTITPKAGDLHEPIRGKTLDDAKSKYMLATSKREASKRAVRYRADYFRKVADKLMAEAEKLEMRLHDNT